MELASAEAPRLVDEIRRAIRVRHYSIRTEETYIQWIRRFILANEKRHPRELGVVEVNDFLSNLALKRNVTASTQNQALSAILFLYQKVLNQDLGWLKDVVRAKKPSRLPVVLTKEEVKKVLSKLSGDKWIMAHLLYGSGLRIMECLRLRVQDIEFSYNQIVVRDGKGQKDRITMLPENLKGKLKTHLKRVKKLHENDIEEGFGDVYLPNALSVKYPNAGKEWAWQYIFPSHKRSIDPRSGKERRHHNSDMYLQRHVKRAISESGIHKHASCHTFRHSFATHLLEAGYDI